MVGTYVYSMLPGMNGPDVSGKAIANLEVESLATSRRPSTVTPSTARPGCWTRGRQSKDDRGVVHVETRGDNQDGKLVCVFRRKVMVPKKSYLEQRAASSPADRSRSRTRTGRGRPP